MAAAGRAAALIEEEPINSPLPRPAS